VDDGSRDNTLQKVKESFADTEKIKILTKVNGGKQPRLILVFLTQMQNMLFA
jgi:glycosyltransferase involved in cell wall biosynthesis